MTIAKQLQFISRIPKLRAILQLVSAPLSKILSNLFNFKYGLRLGEFINTSGNERVKGLSITTEHNEFDIITRAQCEKHLY